MPLLHLIPALMCLGGAAMMALSIRADLAAGTLDWRHATTVADLRGLEGV